MVIDDGVVVTDIRDFDNHRRERHDEILGGRLGSVPVGREEGG